MGDVVAALRDFLRAQLPIAAGSRRVAVTVRDDLRPLTATAMLDLGRALPGQE